MATSEKIHEAAIFVTLTEQHLQDLGSDVTDALAKVPQLWEEMARVEDVFHANAPFGIGAPCTLTFCPHGGSPNATTCKCDFIQPLSLAPPLLTFPERVCIISGDAWSDRPLAHTLNDSGHFWSFTYHLNRLYARLHGYRFRRPEHSDETWRTLLMDPSHLELRRVQWAKVRLLQHELDDESCEYVVWLDSDAFFVTSEPLEVSLAGYSIFDANVGKTTSKCHGQCLFLFASTISNYVNMSTHFMIIRNTMAARELVQRWWEFPLQDTSLSKFLQEFFWEQSVANVLFFKAGGRAGGCFAAIFPI